MATSAEHGHGSHLAHHFESPQQQLAAGKLGMWIFLVTEVLFFSGLFVAYAVYRSAHPEMFADAHRYLSTTLGALNTIVLLLSSLTMAWAVRCAQLNQQRGLLICLGVTLACAGMFLGVKAVEYSAKWQEGLLWAGAFSPHEGAAHVSLISAPLFILSIPALLLVVVGAGGLAAARAWKWKQASATSATLLATGIAFCLGAVLATGVSSLKAHPTAGNQQPTAQHAGDEQATARRSETENPAGSSINYTGINYTGVFFSIYYAMTGVHALHILGGMAVIAWLIWTAAGGRYGAEYFNPVDYVGLYWHLVDVVWIYLFPLLYLIH